MALSNIVQLLFGLLFTMLISSTRSFNTEHLCSDALHRQHLCSGALHRQHCLTSFDDSKAMTEKEFAAVAVKATLDEVLNLSSQNTALTIGSSPAMEDCQELMKWTLRQLNYSLDTLSKPVWGRKEADDVITWLSASLTNQETCMDSLGRWGSKQGGMPAGAMQNVSRLMNSSLAIVNAISGPMPSSFVHNRKLKGYAEEFPHWMSAADRRLLQTPGVVAESVVAVDGTGNFKSVSEAVSAAPSKSNGRYVIHVKAGIYQEKLSIDKDGIMLVGDGKYTSIIRSSKSGATLKSIATVSVSGDGFIARGIGFENDAGPNARQAIALLVGSDHAALYRCSMRSYQDTLYAYTHRQFYRECDIHGTVDFIFGNAVAVIQNSNILARKPPNKYGFLTAQGRTDPNQNCKVTAAPGDGAPGNSMYLGRRWKQYSRTVFMHSFLDSVIKPEGWSPWSGSFALKTLYYGEYMNSGPGAGSGSRVKWPGYHVITTPAVASTFTVTNFLGGTSWIPNDVAYQAGLAR